LAVQRHAAEGPDAIDYQFHAVGGVQTGRASESAAVRNTAAKIGARRRTTVGWHCDSSGAWQISRFAVSRAIRQYRGTRQHAILPGASQTDNVIGGTVVHRIASSRQSGRLIAACGEATLSIVREMTVPFFRGVSFQLAGDHGIASWKLAPLVSRTMLSWRTTEV
jgi:hypothetical protein